MNARDLLKDLTGAFGVSGFESEVRSVIRRAVEPFADSVEVDPLGSLIVRKQGRENFTLLLDAHMDEVGLIVCHVDDRGFLRFGTVGGWDERILPAQAVTVLTRGGKKIRGVLASQPPHILTAADREKPFKVESLFIDVGASTAEDIRAMGIGIGDPVVLEQPFDDLGNGSLVGRAFDDRVGCALLVETLASFSDQIPPVNLVFSFSVTEEVGTRGIGPVALRARPDAALAVECTTAADTPSVSANQQPAVLGKGPAITLIDKSIVVSRSIVQGIEKTAQEADIPFQYKRPVFGSTNAGRIHITGTGIPAAVVAVPCRYIHSPRCLMRMSDYEATRQLVHAIVMNAQTIFSMPHV